jgi:tetratricopeptide (TPR) repeat protein
MKVLVQRLFLIPLMAWGGLCLQGQVFSDDILQKYEAADTRYLRAKDYFQKQNFPASRTELEDCLGLMPEHSEAHYLMARVLVRQGAYRRALDHITKSETYFEFVVKIRAMLEQRRRLELKKMRDDQVKTLTELREILARTSNAASWQMLALQVQEAEKIRDSLTERLLAPQSQSTQVPADYHSFHGDILCRLRKFPEAESEFRLAIQADPMGVDLYNRLAEVYLRTGRAGKALEILELAETNGLTVDEKLKKDVLNSLKK